MLPLSTNWLPAACAARPEPSTPARGRRLIVSNGLFSMDGDCAPLQELDRLAVAQGGRWYIQEFRPEGA